MSAWTSPRSSCGRPSAAATPPASATGRSTAAIIVSFCEAHPHRFDAAFALDFSEHVYDDQFLRIFRAIRGSLKPGAALYVHTPNAEYFMERLKARGILTQVEGHVGVRDAARHEVLFRECGFTDVRVAYLAHYLYVASLFHWLGRFRSSDGSFAPGCS